VLTVWFDVYLIMFLFYVLVLKALPPTTRMITRTAGLYRRIIHPLLNMKRGRLVCELVWICVHTSSMYVLSNPCCPVNTHTHKHIVYKVVTIYCVKIYCNIKLQQYVSWIVTILCIVLFFTVYVIVTVCDNSSAQSFSVCTTTLNYYI